MMAQRPNCLSVKRVKSHRVVRADGFTLIEVMITVLIIAVLAGIAFASYDYAMVKSRRSAAAACLLQGAQSMERYYTTRLVYDAAGFPANLECRTSANSQYTFAAAVTTTPIGYSLTATPTAGSRQAAKDTLCKVLSVNQAGVRGETGTASSASECF